MFGTPQRHAQNPAAFQHQQSSSSVAGRAATSAERGFVAKTPTPRFPHRAPEPEPVCHGCVERSAILAEVAGLREMVLALSNGMLELNGAVTHHKSRIAGLEAQLKASQQAAAAGAQQQQQQQQHGHHQQQPQRGAPPDGIAALVEKMLENCVRPIEARIAATVRNAELDRAAHESRAVRDEISRRVHELEREFERRLVTVESKAAVADRHSREAIAAQERRISRSIFQMCQTLGIATPPAANTPASANVSDIEPQRQA